LGPNFLEDVEKEEPKPIGGRLIVSISKFFKYRRIYCEKKLLKDKAPRA